MKSVACNKLPINTQEKLPWFSLHHVIRGECFVPLVMVTTKKEKTVLSTSQQHLIYGTMRVHCKGSKCR
jgi:hypothetical protein